MKVPRLAPLAALFFQFLPAMAFPAGDADSARCQALLSTAETRAREFSPRPGEEDPWSLVRSVAEACENERDARLVARSALLQVDLPEFLEPKKELELLQPVSERLFAQGVQSSEMIRVLTRIADNQATLGHDDLALEAYEEALEARRCTYGARSPEAANGMFVVAYMHASMAKRGEAESHQRQALAIASDAVSMLREDRGERDQATLESLLSYTGILEELGRDEEAERLRERYGDLWTEASKNSRLWNLSPP